MFVFCFGGTAPSNLLQTAQDVTMHVENGRCTNATDLVSKWRNLMKKNWGLRLTNQVRNPCPSHNPNPNPNPNPKPNPNPNPNPNP